MRNSYLTLLFCLLAFGGKSQSQNRDFLNLYQGALNSKYNIAASLKKIDTIVSGYYWYKTVGVPIPVSGTLKDNKLHLNEQSGETITGSFTGRITLKGDSITGKWTSVDKKKQLPFVMHLDTLSVQPCFSLYRDTLFLKGDTANPYAHSSTELIWDKRHKNALDKLYWDTDSTDKKILTEQLKSKNQEFFASYKKMEADFSSGDEYIAMWESSQGVSIYYYDSKYWVMELNWYEFSGGAHGNWGSRYAIIDISTGKPVDNTTLFIENSADKISELLTLQLKKDLGVPAASSLTEQGLFEEFAPLTANCYLNKKGMGFVYPPYELGPYAMGQVTIFLSYEQLKPVLKPQ